MAVAQDRPRAGGVDPAEHVATVLMAKRDVLLRAYRGRLPHEDLEDCLSQAAMELVTRARSGGLNGQQHIANALEQKFASRIIDRQRSSAVRRTATSAIDDAPHADDAPEFELAAPHGEPSEAAARRAELQRIQEVAAELTEDQRLVLACQVSLGMDANEFCERFGWSPEKFRKVAQRARARLRTLLGEYELGERCQRLEADVIAYAAHAASAAQAGVVREHLANCLGCAAMVRDLRLASRRVGGLLPLPAVAKAGAAVKLAIAAKVSALWRGIAEPVARLAHGAGSAMDGAGPASKACAGMLCAGALAGGGQWAVPKVTHHERPSAPAARTAAGQQSVARRRPVTSEPALRPALLIKRQPAAPGVRGRKGRDSTPRSRRAPIRRSVRPAAAVTPPKAPTPRAPLVAGAPTVASSRPSPASPPSPGADSEFGVE
jgi:RNA polymerase sigma factor (sigma-70 family)